MENETKYSGYVYSKGTKKGFLRMQRLGIPRPPFRLEDKITRKLKIFYKKIISKIAVEFVKQAVNSNAKFKDGQIVTDGSDELSKTLHEAESESSKGVHNLPANRSAVQNSLNSIQALLNGETMWEDAQLYEMLNKALPEFLGTSFDEGASDFLEKFSADASSKMSEILTSFSIDKKQVYQNNIEALKKLYIDDSLKRITWEVDFLKMAFLVELTDYVQGKSDTLNVMSIVKALNGTAERGARFFARDQMQRFNKAQTLATFVSAGVKTVKWCSCRDARVRPSHQALDGKIFNVRDLPKEINDYNCRCGLVPVEYEDD